jgi:predicted HTH domain antitoxin
MTITIPDKIAERAAIDEKSAALELALALYSQQRISGSQVRRMCGLGYFDFLRIVEDRGLPSCYVSDEEVERDLETLRKSGVL